MLEPFSMQRLRYPELAKLAEGFDEGNVTVENGVDVLQVPEDSQEGQPGYDPRNDVYLAKDGKKHWGFHLMMDMGGCNDKIDKSGPIADFLADLCVAINMVAVGEPMIVMFGEGKEGGISALQMITTSNISLHGDNWNSTMYMDVFSCKPFDEKVAIQKAKEFFQPTSQVINFIYRDAPTDQTGDRDALNVGSTES